jgi:hypothetical protein
MSQIQREHRRDGRPSQMFQRLAGQARRDAGPCLSHLSTPGHSSARHSNLDKSTRRLLVGPLVE